MEGLEEQASRLLPKDMSRVFVPFVDIFLNHLGFVGRCRLFVPRSVIHELDIEKRGELGAEARDAIRFIEAKLQECDPIIEFQSINNVNGDGGQGDLMGGEEEQRLEDAMGARSFLEWKVLWKSVGKLQKAFIATCWTYKGGELNDAKGCNGS